jgi:hypothetical protein
MNERNFAMNFEGITPLVMNTNAGLIDGPVDKGRDKAGYEREHFRDLCYLTADRQLYIPARAVKKALVNGCRFMTKKPKGVSFKSYGPLIEAALLIDNDAILTATLDDIEPWTAIVNLDPNKGPKGPRGPRTRPLLRAPWSAHTTTTVMDDLLTLEVLAEIAELAGKRVGLLDARSIDYGRAFISVKQLAMERAA